MAYEETMMYGPLVEKFDGYEQRKEEI